MPENPIKTILSQLKANGASPDAVSDLEIVMDEFIKATHAREPSKAAAALRAAIRIANAEDVEAIEPDPDVGIAEA
jgi:hypothetical protein